MKVSIKWLEQYLGQGLVGDEIAEVLTKLGLEVEDQQSLGKELDKIVVGRILGIQEHPDADKLQICTIDVGNDDPLTIVTGADNVVVGMMVPVALVGARVVGGKIKESKLRGVPSYGMLCSGGELGIDGSLLSEGERSGILPLPMELVPGTDVKSVLSLDDEVLELGLTPNRADCYGIYNVAKEIILKKDLSLKPLEFLEGTAGEGARSVVIREPGLCHRYIARGVRNVKIEPSPLWFANLLRNVGIRPISNIVDVTNYVMFEMGHPMHAFDLDKLSGGIIVERAKEGEVFTTLDGQKRNLDEEMLMIRDGEKSVAIAGIMGGFNSEISGETVNILLEAAHFNSENIRKSSRRLGLRSEASGRFERGLSETNVLQAMDRAMYLVSLLGIGEVDPIYTDSYPVHQKVMEIHCRPARINRILGMDIPEEVIEGIFSRLNFTQKRVEDGILVTPEPHRIDIVDEIDLVEEVVRILGYENIPSTLPIGSTNTLRMDYGILLRDRTKTFLAASGLNEVVTYSFIAPQSYGRLKMGFEADERLRVVNPLSEVQSVMRQALLPGILETASRNYKRQRKDIRLFEVGRVYQGTSGKLPLEELHAGLFLLENKARDWQGVEVIDFFALKGLVENYLEQVSDLKPIFVQEMSLDTYHPGRTAKILLGDEIIGIIGELHPLILADYDIREKAYYAELNLELLGVQKTKSYQPLPKYPSIERDMALLVPRRVAYKDLSDVIMDVSDDRVIEHRIFDVYEGSQIQAGYKSIGITFTYQDPEKTMTDEEVGVIHEVIVQALQDRLEARLR